MKLRFYRWRSCFFALAVALGLATLSGCASPGNKGLLAWWGQPTTAAAAVAEQRAPVGTAIETPAGVHESVAASESDRARSHAVTEPENSPSEAVVLSAARVEPVPQVTPLPPASEEIAAMAMVDSPPVTDSTPTIQLVSDPSSSARPRVQDAMVASAAARPAAPRARPRVVQVTTVTFDDQVLRSEAPVLVDFYATWCGPCKALSPTLDQLAAENPRAKVVKVNIDANPELASRYGVRSIPHLFVFKDGQVVSQEKGVVSKSRLKAMLAL